MYTMYIYGLIRLYKLSLIMEQFSQQMYSNIVHGYKKQEQSHNTLKNMSEYF